MNKIVKMVLAAVIAVAIMIALITGSNILFFWSMFNWLQNTISIVPAMDASLAKGIAAFLVALIVMLPLGKMTLSFTPIPQKNKSLYRSLMFIFVGIFFLFMYLGTEKVYFNPQTGLPMKYYSIGIDGKVCLSPVPGYNPETGDKLLPVTKEIIQKMKGITPSEKIVIPEKQKPVNKIIAQSSPEPKVAKVIIPVKRNFSEARQKVIEKKLTEREIKEEPDSVKIISNELPKSNEPKTLHEILTGRPDPKPLVAEKEREYDGPAGYSFSIVDNPELSKLGTVFEEQKVNRSYRSYVDCETIFNNASRGTFDFFDVNKNFLFRISPKKKSVMIMEARYYYFKLAESSKFIPFNLPERSKFVVKIADERTVAPGEVFTGAIAELEK
jgi:hypothetical protein